MTYDIPTGDRSGTCAFRLMPADELTEAPSTLSVSHAAAGRAVLLTYTWVHPHDGEQAGTLMLGTPDDHGVLTGAWVDTWHQPTVVLLTGREGTLGYDYAPGWRWEVDLELASAVGMVMRNVVPEGQAEPAGPYDVMRARWT